jgi:hypothetical protein
MPAFQARAAVFLSALWWGSLSGLGFVVVPLLFKHLGTPAEAGAMAAKLFSAQTWVSVACTMLLPTPEGRLLGRAFGASP